VIFSLFIICGILFYFFFQNTTLKQKNKLKDIQTKIQQNIINASIDGQESERKKIAAFLHDNISASLSSAALHLNVFNLKNQFQSEEILKTKTILEDAHNQIRDLSHQLMPTLLIRFGLFYALDDLCEKNSNSMMQIKYQSIIPIKTRYNDEFEMKLYFMITELLNNIIKHSQASVAQVSLEKNNNYLLIQVSDNGKGFSTQKLEIAEGFGLNQIRARINNMNGTITVNSKENKGTIIVIKVALVHKDTEKPRFPVHLHDQ
jgi:signal transduction histidine kinase